MLISLPKAVSPRVVIPLLSVTHGQFDGYLPQFLLLGDSCSSDNKMVDQEKQATMMMMMMMLYCRRRVRRPKRRRRLQKPAAVAVAEELSSVDYSCTTPC